MGYIRISDKGCWVNDVLINEKVFDDEMVDYCIKDVRDFINTLIDWIGEATTDKEAMKDDLRMILLRKDEYMFSSISTNKYVFADDEEFDNICKEILEANEKLD